MKVEIEIKNCRSCPYCTKYEINLGDGSVHKEKYYCNHKAFGFNKYGQLNHKHIFAPRVPPVKCPYIKTKAIDRLSERFGINKERMLEILKEEKCEIKDL